MYAVFHSNVDGAGHCTDFASLVEARADAQERQHRSDSIPRDLPNGGYVFNPWCYTYSVMDRHGRTVYRTKSVAPHGEFVKLMDDPWAGNDYAA